MWLAQNESEDKNKKANEKNIARCKSLYFI